jgi:hypothetical protein
MTLAASRTRGLTTTGLALTTLVSLPTLAPTSCRKRAPAPEYAA